MWRITGDPACLPNLFAECVPKIFINNFNVLEMWAAGAALYPE
jgi:hypothetical protein